MLLFVQIMHMNFSYHKIMCLNIRYELLVNNKILAIIIYMQGALCVHVK